ncbi:hypothetical protein RVS70_05605 [Virgibacillus sp. M23]|uniref:hypothetical protein n=1 Tax=Virgibacillus sp. M23 TaxID=3079030 RepID=UPI002A90A47B|nr:hypothetical protein [Virgibacillus sp. M23]MDY7043676.1 hypothetical protein [Virgibacillus sp. M23]
MNYVLDIDLERLLNQNFMSIQTRIDQLNRKERLDIKDISDLQRYTEMQEKITHSLRNIR